MIGTVGQVNRGSKLGEIIYNLCLQDDVRNIVEIGTWNGMGSTKCIYDALSEKKEVIENWSDLKNIDISKELYNKIMSIKILHNFTYDR